MKSKLAALALLQLALTAPIQAADKATPAVPLVDHHLHIFSPAASDALKLLCKLKGPNACSEEVSREPSNGNDAVAALDAAGIRKGTILSGAYFFSSPILASQDLDIPSETRRENKFIVAEAKAHCGRLIPFISVSPLTPSAVGEIDYWGKKGGAVGVKLHLGNSGFDFRSPDQVRKLQAVFAAADRNHFAIIVHLQTKLASYGPEDAKIFIRDVVPLAPDVPIQIAHVGSGGGVNASVLAVLGEFKAAIMARPARLKNLYFDTAMVPDLVSNRRKLAGGADDVRALTKAMREIGLERFLPASDYTLGLDLKAYFTNQRAAFGFSDGEWRQLMNNQAPYVKTAKARICGASKR
jgi:predicted TIM-barrel fold metal-dependent hydrolase